MSASIDMTNLIRGMQAGRERAMAAAQRGLDKAAVHVAGEAAQLCPVSGVPGYDPNPKTVHSGTLKASHQTEPSQWHGDRLEAVIGFNTDYAAAVHEVLTARHAPPTQAKFLETALRQSGPKACEFAAKKAKEAMG